MLTICGTTACWPHLPHLEASAALSNGTEDSLLGRLSTQDIQLCPQNHGILSIERLRVLQGALPLTRFRFHANVRIEGPSRRDQDASRITKHALPYYEALADLCLVIQAPAYTLHAGLRDQASLPKLAKNIRRLNRLFPCPVGVEPMYPAAGHPFLLDSWDELAWLLDSDLPFALDLSHLHIIATRSRRTDEILTAQLLRSPRCLEIHVSDNDGRRDQHRPLTQPPWWWDVFQEACTQEPGPTIFSEGNHSINTGASARHPHVDPW